MIVIQFRQHLLHYRLSEKYRLRAYAELVTILLNGGHLTVIQIDNLPMLAYKSRLLLLEVLRIDSGPLILLLFSHFYHDLKFRQS